MQNHNDNKQLRPNLCNEICNSQIHTLFDAFPESVCIIDPEGIILEANEAFAAEYGKCAVEWQGARIYRLLSPERAANLSEKVNAVFVEKKNLSMEEVQNEKVLLHSIYPLSANNGDIDRMLITTRDITELRSAERSVIKERIFSQSLIESFPGTFYIIDAAGRIIGWNDNLRDEIFGVSEIEMSDTLALDAIHPDDRPRIAEKIASILTRGINDTDEARVLLRGGPEYRYLLLTGRRIMIDQNPVLVGLGIDITERRQVEEKLRQSEARFRNLFDGHAAIKMVIDSGSGRITEANQAAATFYGWPIEELCRMNIQQINTLSQAEIKAEMAMALSGEKQHFSFRHRRADGSLRDVDVFSNSITIDGKEMLYSIIQDVTDRNLAEAEIKRQSRALLAINNCNHALLHAKNEQELLQRICSIIVDTGGYRMAWAGFAEHDDAKSISIVAEAGFFTAYDQHRKLTWADVPQGRGPAGIAIRTAQPCKINDILTNPLFEPWRKDALHHGFASLITLPLVADTETFGLLGVYSASPDAFDAVETNFLMSLANNLAYGLKNSRDSGAKKIALAENEKLQDQLQHAQKMEMLGQLAGGIAHDFNNMLAVILGHSEMALEEPDLAQPLRADINSIRKAAIRSADMTNQLLAFARKQSVQPKVLELNAVIESTLPVLHRLIGENITLTWKPGGGEALVMIDPVQIDQILVNLCINSRDAIAGAGTISIETQRLSVRENQIRDGFSCLIPGEYLMLIVTDNGSGISKTVLPHIFEPFFTTKEIGKGTGLGLSTVYGIIKQSQGFIDCLSEVGEGTSIRVYLPRVNLKSEITTPQLPDTPQRSDATILLVEDELTILTLCKTMLEKSGYRVLKASTPAEAFSVAEAYKGEFELLITDVIMPEMNGCELSKRLQLTNPNLKTLFISGYTADVLSDSVGFDRDTDILIKPFGTRALTAKVSELLPPPPRRAVR